MPDACRCHCHETERGVYNAARHMQNYVKAFVHAGQKRYHVAPLVTNVVESVTACDLCAQLHGRHQSTRRPWVDPPRRSIADSGEGSE